MMSVQGVIMLSGYSVVGNNVTGIRNDDVESWAFTEENCTLVWKLPGCWM